MNATEWEIALAPGIHWRKAYDVVEVEARRFLSTLAPGTTIRTNGLVEALYPLATVHGESNARRRIYHALLAHNKEGPGILRDCRIRGPETRIYGGVKAKVWLWHSPAKRMICCPNCQYEWELA